jgi:hypothetical protein
MPWLVRNVRAVSLLPGRPRNLCENIRFTGLHADGGFAVYGGWREVCYPIPLFLAMSKPRRCCAPG